MAQRRELNPSSSWVTQALIGAAMGLLILTLTIVWISLHGAASWAGSTPPARNPFQLLVDLLTGQHGATWSWRASVIAASIVVVLGVLVGVVVALWRGRRGRTGKRPDPAARWMATGSDMTHLTEKGARAKAERLGVQRERSPGVPLGLAVRTGAPLFSSWEDMIVVVAGPRTMKTTAMAIPAIMSAPGAVLATSNKRDVVDATRGPRAQFGQVWIFDPQEVANHAPDWWWNPLTYIAPYDPLTKGVLRDPRTGYVVAREDRAEKLAGQFCASAISVDARKDAYFDNEAENLIGLMLLAAACGEVPITTVYTWLATPTEQTPVGILQDNGFKLHGESLYALARLPEKQREGVYGTARARMGFLRNRRMAQWITPGVSDRQFHPLEYAASTDTLYPLSREGEGSAGPLVAAITVAVIDALEERATASPGGRLTTPFLAVLDEAANICRFRNLDSYYSHFGSRGIIIETILQNWAQGEEVWGVKGMEKLWSAANVKVYGGGVDDDKFLRRISDLIGTHTHVQVSESISSGAGQRGHVSVSRSSQERVILTIGELRELPQGRAVVFASGTPATLVEPQPWFTGPDAEAITSSLDLFGPEATRTAAPASAAGWNVGAMS